MKIFNTPNIALLKKSLDVYTKQHEAIAKNIANANNSAYKPEKTDFSELLKNNMEHALKTTNPRHIAHTQEPERELDNNGAEKTVDISREMGELAENQIRYDFASRALNRTYRGLFGAITGKGS